MKKPTPVRKSTRTTFRPRLESLETRLTPTTYTVSSLADSGEGSLRAAITSVNGDNSADEIDFTVAGVIQLTSGALPAITNTVKINGASAPNFSTAPLLELSSQGGLVFNADLCTLQALSIIGGRVSLNGSFETVVGNYIGLALDGTPPGDRGGGIFIDSQSQHDTIGGITAADRNVIGGGVVGIQLGSTGSEQVVQSVTIEGNFIGTDPTGQSGAGNLADGILIFSSGNTVGGTDAGAGNVIANNFIGSSVRGGASNAIIGNSIYDNAAIGIQLESGNQNQAAPTLLFALQTGTNTQITGTLNGQVNTTYSVQIFASPHSGQGRTLLGTVSATTDASGLAAFTLNAQVPSNAGSFFTSLATSPSNNTSMFSADAQLCGTTNEAFVASAYGLLLHRAPYTTGTFWVDLLNNGASTAQVLLGIQGSDEYLRDQVAALYLHYLQRGPDTDGGQAWLNYLQAGGSFEGMAEGLTSSPEYLDLQGGTNQGFITGLYHDVLNRKPGDAEIAGWEAALNNGTSRLDVSVAFLTSPEYRTNLVQADYTMFLLRPADSGGLTAFVNALNAGATDQQVLAAIFGSPEGYRLWS